MRFHSHWHADKFFRVWLAAVTALTLAAVPIRTCAQQNSCTQKSVFINVADDQGQPVPGLAAANFHVSAGKQTISVTSAAPSSPSSDRDPPRPQRQHV